MKELSLYKEKRAAGNRSRTRSRSLLQRLDRVPDSIQAWILPVALLVVWQFAGFAGWLSPTLLPTPLEIAAALLKLIGNGRLFLHLRSSVLRAAAGFLLGGSIGLVFGIAAGLSRWVEQTVDPFLQMLRTVPHLAVISLFILWFGIGELSKVLLISLGTFFPLYINTFMGIRNVDRKWIEVTRVLQFSRIQQLRKLVLPAALPNILLGVRLSIGISWLGLVVAEMMSASSGIGYMITDARQYSQTDIVFVGIGIFALVGWLSDALVRVLEARLLRWRDAYKG